MAAAEILDRGSLTDNELIENTRGGDEESFRILYGRYFRRVYNFVDKRLRNRADTEETVQEVFINVFSSLASYRGDAPFAAWVLGVSRRTVANRFKKKRHPTVSLDLEESEKLDPARGGSNREPTPLEIYEGQERARILELAAQERLSPEQRTMFEMHHLEHQSISEIARATDKSVDAVKSNLYRARKLLLLA